MSEDDRNERERTMVCHLETIYSVFRSFCDKTRPEKAPLKNYMKFVLSCMSDLLDEDKLDEDK